LVAALGSASNALAPKHPLTDARDALEFDSRQDTLKHLLDLRTVPFSSNHDPHQFTSG
jgi:hypothetical protein